MSDMWQVPADLADRVAASDYAVAWGREIERTAEVRGILTDLIDHLREWEKWQRDHPMDNPDYLGWLADRAEARLKEVQGE